MPTSAQSCPICNGMGFVTRDVPVGHPDFGKAFPCECQREAIEARKLQQIRSLSNLDIVGGKTFETFITDPMMYTQEQIAVLRDCFDQARHYAANPEGWLLFRGNYGSGKTHLAVAIANYRLALGESVLFMTTPDLLDHLRATFGPTSQIQYDNLFERLRNAPLLVLDDLGAESPTPWAQEKLFQLINHRYLHRLPTVVTTNTEPDQLDPRIQSRLEDQSLTVIVQMALPDFRRSANSIEQNIFDLGLYGSMVFETFDFRHDALPERERRNLRAAFDLAHDYAQGPRDWLVFQGEHGCGKTHLAASIANLRHNRLGEAVILVTVPNLLDYLRATFGPGASGAFSKRFYEIRSAPLLILDQLDLTNASSWALEKIRQIVDHRYLTHAPTVFTTTQPLEELDPLIRSRLLDARYCKVFAILAPDYRGGRGRFTPAR